MATVPIFVIKRFVQMEIEKMQYTILKEQLQQRVILINGYEQEIMYDMHVNCKNIWLLDAVSAPQSWLEYSLEDNRHVTYVCFINANSSKNVLREESKRIS